MLTIATGGGRNPIVGASLLKMPIHCSAVLGKPNGPLRREQRTKRDINSSCFCSPSAAYITACCSLGDRAGQGRQHRDGHRGVEKLF